MYVCIAGAFLVCLFVCSRDTQEQDEPENMQGRSAFFPPSSPIVFSFDLRSAFVGLNLLLCELQITHHTAHTIILFKKTSTSTQALTLALIKV